MPQARAGARLPGILSVARFIREHRSVVARTLRETFGVGISDLGGALTWGEAKLLIEEAVSDPSTALGAHLADWGYPASMLDLLHLAATIQDPKSVRKVAPWTMPNPRKQQADQATPDEVAAAEAELEAGVVFA